MVNRPTDPGGKTSSGRETSGPAPWEDEPGADADTPVERDPNTNDMFGATDATPAAEPANAPPAQVPRAPGGPAKPYVVLARKYRPRSFEDLIGQDAMVTTLRNAFATDRIAQAYMLTGVRGVGKTTTARILARGLNYSGSGTPGRPSVDLPGLGEHCTAIIESRHPDIIEMDAASNTGVDNVREIIEGARYKPTSARYKVYIIDEVHMLSRGAFNALLKTLEEPPEHVKFIFATTEIRKVPVTVLSRCQRFDLRRIGADLLVQQFKKISEAEGATVEPEALALIARAAEGSSRDGLSILDQAIATAATSASGGKVAAASVRAMLGLADRGRVFDLIEAVFSGDAAGALERLAALHKDGADPLQLLSDLAETVHLASRAKVAGPGALGELLSETERTRAAGMAERLSLPALARAWQMLLKGLDEAGRAPQPVAAVEMLVIRMAYTADLPTPEEMLRGAGPRPAVRTGAALPANGGNGQGPAPRAQLPTPQPAGTLGQTHGSDPGAATSTEPDMPLASFAELVEFVGAKRDARLKVMLENNVSLVRYEPGQIDFYLLSGAPRELANELREKLNQWTGRKWMVALSREPGAKSIGEVRQEREDAEMASAMRDPLVLDMLKHFPDAEVLGVRAIGPDIAESIGTGDPEDDGGESDDGYATG
jgi:DNA polymerase III subunit gamma/tau